MAGIIHSASIIDLALTGEPTYNAGTQTLVIQSNVDGYADWPAAKVDGWLGSNFGARDPDTTTSATSTPQIISPGFGGSGKLIRNVWNGVDNGSGQEVHSCSHYTNDILCGRYGHAMYVSYRFRITPTDGSHIDQDNQHNVKIKWLELWDKDLNDRVQYHTSYPINNHNVTGVSEDYGGSVFQMHATNGDTHYWAGQCIPPFLYNLENQVCTATHKYMNKSGASASDGIAQMWLNSVKILDVSAATKDVPVPGGRGTPVFDPVQTWCTQGDLDSLPQDGPTTYRSLFLFGGNSTSGLWAYNMDIDRVKVWRD